MTPYISKSLRIVGKGKFTGKRKAKAVSRVKSTGLATKSASKLVDKISGMTNKKFVLTPANRKKAIALVRKETGLSDKDARALVRATVNHTRKVGGNFFDWLWKGVKNVGKSIVGSIPIVGAAAKEGLDALDEGRAYNWKRAGINTGISLLPGGALVKGAADLALTHSGLRKKIGAGRKTTKRAQIVKRVMKEQGLSLPDASRYVKEHDLYSSSSPKEPKSKPTRRTGCDTMRRRGQMVSRIMRERGVPFGVASHIIKSEGIEY